MIEVNIGALVSATEYLAALVQVVASKPNNAQISPDSRKIYLKCFESVSDSIKGLDLKASEKQLDRLIANLEAPPEDQFTYDNFKKFGQDCLLRLRDELEMTKFLLIENSKIGFYEQGEPLFGDSVAAQYPSAHSDIAEAGKCLALGWFTACVFHLMRALEVGVAAVASGLNIPDPVKPAHRNWGYVLTKIKEAIDGRKN
jgi:hypothetical protein